jgi:predicted nucleic acid-binding protein
VADGGLVQQIVYDAGALLAAERLDARVLAMHRELLRSHVKPLVPTVVLAQAWRGGPQHGLSQMLKGCDVVPDDERIGRAAGSICASARTSDVVDAIVVAIAIQRQASVVTSDPGDLTQLAGAIGVKLPLFAI